MRNGPLAQSPVHLLHRAGQCADEIFQREMTTEVTPRQLAVLMTVVDNAGGNQASLVEATGIDRSTLRKSWDVS